MDHLVSFVHNNESRRACVLRLWYCSYSAAPEILEYFKAVASKYALYKYIKLRHRIVEAVWVEDTSRWLLKVEDLSTGLISKDWCDFLINSSGILK